MMAMDYQQILNLALGLGGAVGGWIIKSLWDAIHALQVADKEITDRVAHIEVLVAGSYVKRDELERLSKALFSKLDRIDEHVTALRIKNGEASI